MDSGPQEPPRSWLLAAALVVGSLVFLVGLGTGSVLGALGGLVGLAVAVAALVIGFRRAGILGRLALGAVAGVLVVLVGLGLGILSYDERYFGDESDRAFWDAVSWVGAGLLGLGLLLAAASIVGLAVATVVRAVRRG